MGQKQKYNTHKGKYKGYGGMKALFSSNDAQCNQEQKNNRIQHPGSVLAVYGNVERVITFIDLSDDSHPYLAVGSV